MIRQNRPRVKWLQVALAIVLALGVFVRFVNLDQKPYWHDEIYTSLRVSGYTAKAAMQQLYTGQETSIEALHRYQQASADKSAIDTMQGLAAEEPQHPPLYYTMARLWAQTFGSSVTAMRLLPALISLLGFPAIYWLCLELFGSAVVGWVATALFAISPVYVRYAQEARQYSLWTVMILLSSAALLRAMRNKTALSWGIYAATAVAGLYCHLLFGLVLIAHGLYVLVMERGRLSRNVISYLLAGVTSVVLFSPWLWEIWTNREILILTTDWMKQPLPLGALVQAWGVSLAQLFVAWYFRYNNVLVYLAIPLLGLLALSIYALYRHTPKRVWLFVVILIAVTSLPLILPDLMWAGKRSTNPRYLLPGYLGIHLAIAYLLTTQLFGKIASVVQTRLWRGIAVLLISSSVLTCALSANASTWWGWSEFDVEVSRIISQSSQPLVISDMPLGVIMPLSHRLNRDTTFQLLFEPNGLKLPDGRRNVFVYNPSDRLKAALEQQGLTPTLIYQFKDNSLVISLYQVNDRQ